MKKRLPFGSNCLPYKSALSWLGWPFPDKDLIKIFCLCRKHLKRKTHDPVKVVARVFLLKFLQKRLIRLPEAVLYVIPVLGFVWRVVLWCSILVRLTNILLIKCYILVILYFLKFSCLFQLTKLKQYCGICKKIWNRSDNGSWVRQLESELVLWFIDSFVSIYFFFFS